MCVHGVGFRQHWYDRVPCWTAARNLQTLQGLPLAPLVASSAANSSNSNSSNSSDGSSAPHPHVEPNSTLSFAFVSKQLIQEYHGTTHVWMHNVTLLVPPDDFVAMAVLALSLPPQDAAACLSSPDALQLFDHLQQDVERVTLGNDVSQVADGMLLLSVYTGWGVNSTQLRLVPQDPQSEQMQQLRACVQARTQGSSTSRAPVVVGAVVGSVCGAALLVVGAVWALVAARCVLES
jgi:hypothetical protein